MEYRQLGNSGVRVSAIGLGTNQFGGKVEQEEVNNIIDVCLDLGINFIDTADAYQEGRSEQTLGKALKGRWDRFVLATKVFAKTGEGTNDRGTSRYHIMNGVDASLKRLDSDHIDLYQMHRWDDSTPIEETIRALDDLIRMGKVRYIGASGFASWQLAQANLLAEFKGLTPLISVQSHYHLFEREVEREVLPYCASQYVGFIPYFPLAGGFLTGKYMQDSPPPPGSRGESSVYVQRYMNSNYYEVLEQLIKWSEKRGRNITELAHSWLLSNPAVCWVISGATKMEHVQKNAKSARWSLTEKEKTEVDAILEQIK